MRHSFPSALALLALASLVRGSDVRTKLNGPLTFAATTGDVHELALSPDGQWVAYLADQDTAGKRELYAVRRDGTGSSIKLNGTLVAGGAIHRFSFTPDGARVLYHADQDTDNDDELYSVPVDGSAPAVKLSGPGQVSWIGNPWRVTSDGQTVVYTAELTGGQRLLYSAPTDGSAAPVPLFVLGPNASVALSLLASDDVTVVFLADLLTDNDQELFKVPIDGSAAPVRLNGTITPGTDVLGFDLAPDGSRAIYRADRGTPGKIEVFSVPLDLSSPAVALNGSLQAQGDVSSFLVSGSSQRVVYLADQESDQAFEIYSAPIDGSASAVKLNDPLGVGSISYQISPDGNWVVYRYFGGNAFIYTVPVDRSSNPVALTPGPSDSSGWAITPDSTRILFTKVGLYSIPIDGSGASTLLSQPYAGLAQVRQIVIAADSENAVYTLGALQGANRLLFSVAVDGSAPPVHLSPGSEVWSQLGEDYAVDAASDTVLYRANTSVAGVTELFAVPLDASAPPMVLNDPLPTGTVMGEVTSFAVSPDGNWAVYADAKGFHGAPIVRRGPAKLLTPPGLSSGNGLTLTYSPEVGFTPDSKRVFVSLTTEASSFLYRAPVDGTEPAGLVQVIGGSGSLSWANRYSLFRFTPDGATVVYAHFSFFSSSPTQGALYSAPVDGSAAPTHLSNGALSSLLLSGDGTRAVYAASGFLGTSLWSVPVDGSSGPVSLLPGAFESGGDLFLAADGATVVYRVLGGGGGLLSSPADASSAPTVLVSGDVSLNRVNPVTPHVAYLLVGGGVRQLYHGPVDGSSAATLLASLPLSVTLHDLIFSPDGSRIVYRASAASKFELYSVPTDGSQAPVKVNGPIVGGGNVTGPPLSGTPHFAITPDGLRVVYRADARVAGIFELWSAPSAGGGPATMLHNPFTPGLGASSDFRLLANSRDILFRGNSASGVLPLWQGRVDQAGPFKLRSGPFAHPSVVEEGFQVTAGEKHAVYRSDHDVQGVTELYAFPLRHVVYRDDLRD